jgi:hypothetical protein
MKSTVFQVSLYMAAMTTVAHAAPEYRPFNMGFSSWPHGPTLAAVNTTWEKIHENGDLVSIQFNNGVPWVEAYAGTPFSSNVMNKIAYQKSRLQPGEKVYLEVAPANTLRTDLADYWGDSEAMPRPGEWERQNLTTQWLSRPTQTGAYILLTSFTPTTSTTASNSPC